MKLLFLLFMIICSASLYAQVEFYSSNTIVTNRIRLPDDVAVKLRKDITNAPVVYLDRPMLPAIPEFCLNVDGKVYWCFLMDDLFFPETDRAGHAKTIQVKAIGFLSSRLGGVERKFYKDKELETTVVSALREFYMTGAGPNGG
jgi:hypothetical protein